MSTLQISIPLKLKSNFSCFLSLSERCLISIGQSIFAKGSLYIIPPSFLDE